MLRQTDVSVTELGFNQSFGDSELVAAEGLAVSSHGG